MIKLISDVKARYNLRTIAVSNEGRELTTYRVKKFNMTDFIDAFIVSSFVHYRKPDKDMFQMALDVSQTPAEQVVYIDDRALFVQVACELGVNCIHHVGLESTKTALAGYGLSL
jgi:putative hydrolase of the HAD superfamily